MSQPFLLVAAPLTKEMASSHQVAFITLPAGFCKAKWKAQIQMRTDAVSCLSVAPRSSPIVFRDSAVDLRALAADVANATGRTAQTSHSGQFAVIWDEAKCECSHFAAAPWGIPCAQMFQIKLLGSATEHVAITCVHGYAESKHSSHILMREFFKAVCQHPAYILGGCFGINAFSISKYTEGHARARKWKRVPLLLMLLQSGPTLPSSLTVQMPVLLKRKGHHTAHA